MKFLVKGVVSAVVQQIVKCLSFNEYIILRTQSKRRSGYKRLRDCSLKADSIKSFERICIFAAYDAGLNYSTIEYLKFIKSMGFGIIYVNNTSIEAIALEKLNSLCEMVFERKNIGRDIGAYRDVFLFIYQNGILENAKYLLYANDSVTFIPGKFATTTKNSILEAMEYGYDGIYSHRNYCPASHYQSFFSLVSKNIFTSKLNIQFWEDYIPLSDRTHSIINGEIKWSQKVLNSFNSNSIVLYSPERFLGHIKAVKIPEGIGPIQILMPSISASISDSVARDKMFNKFVEYNFLFEEKNMNIDASEYLSTIESIDIAKLMVILENTNQTHSAAFLYPMVLSCPFIKMDLCTAGSFTISMATYIYKSLLSTSWNDEDELKLNNLGAHFHSKLDAKGIPSSYTNDKIKAYLRGIGNGFQYPKTIKGWID